MDKWTEAIISYKNILLGLSWNTRKLTVGIPREYNTYRTPRSNQEKPLSLQENHGLRAQQDHRENGAHRSSCQLDGNLQQAAESITNYSMLSMGRSHLTY
eukprot:scaffold2771_cov198-Skeletonema_marinoi.AAC.1